MGMDFYEYDFLRRNIFLEFFVAYLPIKYYKKYYFSNHMMIIM